MIRFFLAFVSLFLASAGIAQAQTVLCAPIEGFASMSRQIFVPNSGNTYTLDPRGCLRTNSITDLAYLQGQGLVQEIASGPPPQGGSGVGIGQYAITNAFGDGVNDDTAAVQATLNACAAGGGGQVIVSPSRYLIDSADLIIPQSCEMYCPAPPTGTCDANNTTCLPENFWRTSKYTFILNSAHSIRFGGTQVVQNVTGGGKLGANTGWKNCTVLAKNVLAGDETTVHGQVAVADQMNSNGTAFNIVDVPDVSIAGAGIFGFNIGVNAFWAPRPNLRQLHIDANNCVVMDNIHDIGHLNEIECYVYLSRGPGRANYTVDSFADNGSGQYRVTYHQSGGTTATLATGDFVNFSSGAWFPSRLMTSRHKITVIDPTHFDMADTSTAAVSVTADVSNNTMVLSNLLTSTNIAPLQTVTGPQITSPTIVTWVALNGRDLGISHPRLSGTDLQLTFTFSEPTLPITPVGAVFTLDAGIRYSPSFTFTNSEGINCIDCFSFSHTTGFLLSNGDSIFSCTGCGVDTSLWIPRESVGVKVGGTATGIMFNSLQCSGFPSCVWIDTPNQSRPSAFIGGIFANSGQANGTPVIEIDRGSASFVGSANSFTGRYVVINDATSGALFAGNLNQFHYAWESSLALARTVLAGNYMRPNAPQAFGGPRQETTGVANADPFIGRGTDWAPGDTAQPEIDGTFYPNSGSTTGGGYGQISLINGARLVVADTLVNGVPSIQNHGAGCGVNATGVNIFGTTGTGLQLQMSGTIVGGALSSIDTVNQSQYVSNPTDFAHEPLTVGTCAGVTASLSMGISNLYVQSPGIYRVFEPGSIVAAPLSPTNGSVGQLGSANLYMGSLAATILPSSQRSGAHPGGISHGYVGNTSFGSSSLDSFTLGGFNTAYGWVTLHALTTGHDNTAIGTGVLGATLSGSSNAAVGPLTGANASDVSSTVLMGAGVAAQIRTIGNDVLIGSGILPGPGNANVDNHSFDDVIIGGTAAPTHSASLSGNVIVGATAATAITSGSANVILGWNAGKAIINGSDNIVIGRGVAPALASGVRNILLGTDNSCDTTATTTNDEFRVCSSKNVTPLIKSNRTGGGGTSFSGFTLTLPISFGDTQACGASTEGAIQAFKDSNTAVWGNAIAAGGANHVLGYCNGSNWTVMGK